MATTVVILQTANTYRLLDYELPRLSEQLVRKSIVIAVAENFFDKLPGLAWRNAADDSAIVKRIDAKAASLGRAWNPRWGERCNSVYSFAVANIARVTRSHVVGGWHPIHFRNLENAAWNCTENLAQMFEDADPLTSKSNLPSMQQYFPMMTRCRKRIARPAMLWLLVAIFALPTSFVRLCPCSLLSCKSQCDCNSLVTDFSANHQPKCCRTSPASAPCKAAQPVADHGLSFGLSICHCTDRCPCDCERDERKVERTNGSRRVDFRQSIERTLEVATEYLCAQHSQTCTSRFGCLPIVYGTTAQQRCATLSRFLI